MTGIPVSAISHAGNGQKGLECAHSPGIDKTEPKRI